MSRITVGIVDYGVGNHASVWRTLHLMGYRCRVSGERAVLDAADLLLLPGVGAFPSAIAALHQRNLFEYLLDHVQRQKPLVGICLGMQLLADASYENGYTKGLGLIPGEIVPLENPRWHIGWNTIEQIKPEALLQASSEQSFYFNHSYVYTGPDEFKICQTRQKGIIPAVVKRGNVLGIQFHPEKSQAAGQLLLSQVINGLCNA